MFADLLPDAIVLNGASSSGKTSTARALQEALPTLFLNFSIDGVLYSLPPSELAAMMAGERILRPDYDYEKLVRGYHAAIRGLLAAGNRLIIDNAVVKCDWRLDLERQLQSYRSFWVGVSCQSRVLAERERRRGDRAHGTAEREASAVHHGFCYDVMIDTTSCSPEQSAAVVLEAMTLKLGR